MVWYGYKLLEYDPHTELTVGRVVRLMSCLDYLKKDFKVEIDPVDHVSFIVWDIKLERLRQKKNTRQIRSNKTRCALNVEEEVLYCNKLLNKKMKDAFCKGFHCTALEEMSRQAGIPSQLTMLHLQRKNNKPGLFPLQHQKRIFKNLDQTRMKYPLSSEIDVVPDDCKEVHLSLGSEPELIPQVSRVSIGLKNMPVNSKRPKLQGYRIDKVAMTVEARSVFHLYLNLAEQKIIPDIPPWIKKMREHGVTDRSVHFN